jgi:hypothetical protein
MPYRQPGLADEPCGLFTWETPVSVFRLMEKYNPMLLKGQDKDENIALKGENRRFSGKNAALDGL